MSVAVPRLPGYAIYGRPLPNAGTLFPSSGPVAGGVLFAVPGTNLFGTTGVTFAGNPATGVNIVGAGIMVQGYTPPGAPGEVDVVLEHPLGDLPLNPYTYTDTEAEGPPDPDPEEVDPEEPDPEGEAESEGGEE